jgi:GNAT superfamily N-acetyltransferase
MFVTPLDKENLSETISLTKKVFSSIYELEVEATPEIAFKASLETQVYADFFEQYHIKKLEYFVLIDKEKVIGVTGLYTQKTDDSSIVWLGWFCIDPSKRRQGLGKYLLSWTIEEATKRGFSIMKLYTSDDPSEATAQYLYDSFGFTTYKTEKSSIYENLTITYKEKNLQIQ